MLKGIDINQISEFSVSKDKDPKTIFMLKPLTGLQMLDVSQRLQGQSGINADYIESLLDKAVVGVKNPDISESDAINKYIEGLDSLSLMEIVSEIGTLNNLTENESKN